MVVSMPNSIVKVRSIRFVILGSSTCSKIGNRAVDLFTSPVTQPGQLRGKPDSFIVPFRDVFYKASQREKDRTERDSLLVNKWKPR